MPEAQYDQEDASRANGSHRHASVRRLTRVCSRQTLLDSRVAKHPGRCLRPTMGSDAHGSATLAGL